MKERIKKLNVRQLCIHVLIGTAFYLASSTLVDWLLKPERVVAVIKMLIGPADEHPKRIRSDCHLFLNLPERIRRLEAMDGPAKED
jgi:hypothetical protein